MDNARTPAQAKSISSSIIFSDDSELDAVSNDAGDASPVTSDMHFGIGSVTKMFIAGCILKLIEENKITLDDTLQTLLYDPTIPNPKSKLSSIFRGVIDPRIRIRDLLNHTSGLNDFAGIQYYYDIYWDALAKWDPFRTLSYMILPHYEYDYTNPENNTFYYANTNYILLGMIIENISGNKVFPVITDYFLQPLQLEHTFMAGVDPYWGLTSIPGTIATGFDMIDYSWVEASSLVGADAIAVYTSAWTSGNMLSNAGNMAKWAKYYYYYQLQNGYLDESDDNRFWNQDDNDDELKNACSTCTKEYGLGLMKFDFSSIIPGCTVYGHTGSIIGYKCFVLYWPAKDISFVVLTNNDSADKFRIMTELLQYLNTINL